MRRKSPRTSGCSCTSSTPTTNGCGPTITTRQFRRRSGSRGRPSNTPERCSCRSCRTRARPKCSWGSTRTPRTRAFRWLAPIHDRRSYIVGNLDLLKRTEGIFVMFKEGWHAAETPPDNAAVEWQWTRKEADLSVRNPKKDVMLYLHLDSPGLFPEPQQVTVTLGDQTIDSFVLEPKKEVIRKPTITAAQLGTADVVDLKISVDKIVCAGCDHQRRQSRSARAWRARIPRLRAAHQLTMKVRLRPHRPGHRHARFGRADLLL